MLWLWLLKRSLFLLLMASSENIIFDTSILLASSVETPPNSLIVDDSVDAGNVVDVVVVDVVVDGVVVESVVVVVEAVVVVDVVFVVLTSLLSTSLSPLVTPNISKISLRSGTSDSVSMFMLSLSSHTTFVTFLLTFCGTFSTTCLHSS